MSTIVTDYVHKPLALPTYVTYESHVVLRSMGTLAVRDSTGTIIKRLDMYTYRENNRWYVYLYRDDRLYDVENLSTVPSSCVARWRGEYEFARQYVLDNWWPITKLFT